MSRAKITPREWCAARDIDLRLYQCWVRARQRCANPKNKDWRHYGGRGIRICKRWEKFDNFAADMGPHPGKGYSLDRKNNNGNYCRGNCRWATARIQQRNRRNVRMSFPIAAEIRRSYQTGAWSYSALARRHGVSIATVARVVVNETWN